MIEQGDNRDSDFYTIYNEEQLAKETPDRPQEAAQRRTSRHRSCTCRLERYIHLGGSHNRVISSLTTDHKTQPGRMVYSSWRWSSVRTIQATLQKLPSKHQYSIQTYIRTAIFASIFWSRTGVQSMMCSIFWCPSSHSSMTQILKARQMERPPNCTKKTEPNTTEESARS